MSSARCAAIICGCATLSLGTMWATGCGSSTQMRPAEERMTAVQREAALAAADAKAAKLRRRGPKTYDQPDKAYDFFMAQRVTEPDALYPMEEFHSALSTVRTREVERLMTRGSEPTVAGISTWRDIGPGNVGGRTRSVVIDPTNPSIMYAGGVAGGVWKSVDAGASWNPTDDFLVNLGIASIVMNPDDTSILYAATGDGKLGGSSSGRGFGIFKSTDAGTTWTQLPGTTGAEFLFTSKLALSPNNPDIIYAGTWSGVWRSIDAGNTWQLVLRNPSVIGGTVQASNGSDAGCTDLVIRQDSSPDVIFAMFGNFDGDGLFRSDDGGDTWLGYSVPSNQGRMTMAIAPSNNDIMYLAMADSGVGGFAGKLVNVYRTLDGGETWEARVNLATDFGPNLFGNVMVNTGCIEYTEYHQGWYDQTIAVDPIDPNTVWIGGVDLFRSDDGGVNWGLAEYWIYGNLPEEDRPPQYLHADQHTIVFHPNYDGVANQTMFVGNDGGIYKTDNALAATSQEGCPIAEVLGPFPEIVWTSLNNSYGVTQFYHGDAAKATDRFIGGCQDNGTNMVDSRTTPDEWDVAFGGDGGYVAIDPTDPDTFYLEIQFFPEIRKTTDGGATIQLAVDGITDTDGLFIAPFEMDQNDPQVLWTGGTRPWRTTNGAASWELVGTDFAGANQISAIGIAPSDSNVVYLGFNNGYVARSTNALSASPTWTVFPNGLRIGSWVSSVAVDPSDPDTAYVSYSTFGGSHIYKTTNGGVIWFPTDGIQDAVVPDIPVHWVAVRPCNTDHVYAGTELGVFASEDAGSTWQPANTGLANTIVETVDVKDDNTLVAFTHGRGVFVADLTGCCPCEFDGDQSAVTINDLLAFLALWFADDPAADLDGDGVGINDLLAYLSCWFGAMIGASC